MKILILQLARLGDIYLSWPGLRALKRAEPGCRIEMLTRPKFADAARGLEAVDEIIELPTKALFEPLVRDSMDVVEAHSLLTSFVRDLKGRGYDRIINLSFSPASSYLTHLLERDSGKVRGYTRSDDGFLAIPDDMSAYFYAQVGPNRPNRFHLAEIFGTLCGVDLTEADWAPPALPRYEVPVSGAFVVLHVGASETQKSVSPAKWVSVLSQFRALTSVPVVLIGSEADRAAAGTIMASSPSGSVVDLTGRTTLAETMSVISQARVLVGADSAPMHMASLTGTRCLNLSLGRVNFWETGPRAGGSWIIRASGEADLPSDKFARAMKAILDREKPELGVIQTQPGTPSYAGLFPREAEFHWKLVQAVYQGTPFPEPVTAGFQEAHAQLLDINAFILEQLESLKSGARLEEKAPFIDRGEEVIEAIAKLVPAWGPVIRWYQTEKIRIGPETPERVLDRTLEIQNLLQQVLELYADMKTQEASTESEAP